MSTNKPILLSKPMVKGGNEPKNIGANCICRLCLKESDVQYCSLFSGIKTDMLAIVLPDLNLIPCTFATICFDCEQLLEDSCAFKSACLELEEKLIDHKKGSLRNFIKLEDILKHNGSFSELVAYTKVCRTCLKVCPQKICTPMKESVGDPLMDMIDKCLPEISIYLTKDPVICKNCLESLEILYNFVWLCMDSEEKITYYREMNNSTGIVDLFKMHAFISKMEKSLCADYPQKLLMRVKSNQTDKNAGSSAPVVNGDKADTIDEVVILDSDNEDSIEDSIDVNKGPIVNGISEKAEENKVESNTVNREVDDKKLNDEEQKEKNKSEEIEDVTQIDELLQVKKVVKLVEKPPPKVVKKVKESTETTKLKSIYYEEEADDEPVFKKRKFACPKCNQKFKLKGYIKYHLKTKCKGILNNKDHDNDKIENVDTVEIEDDNPPKSSEFTPRKCRMCPVFLLTHEEMISHLKVHRIHKCSNCPMVFIRKGMRNKHQDACFLKSKTRKKRLIAPSDSSETVIKKPKVKPKPEASQPSDQNSEKIRYGHKQSYIFDRHKLTMYKCKLCPYQTRDNNNFNRHNRVHQQANEMKWYRCSLCPFKTTKQSILDMHIRNHKIAEESGARKCFLCSFSTSDEIQFQKHLLEHKS